MSALSVKESQKTLQERPRNMNLHILLTHQVSKVSFLWSSLIHLPGIRSREGSLGVGSLIVVAKNARIYGGEAKKN